MSQNELNETLIDIVIQSMVKQVATESLKLNDLAMNKAFSMITTALKASKQF